MHPPPPEQDVPERPVGASEVPIEKTEPYRLRGTTRIPPDWTTNWAMQDDGKKYVEATFKFCLDPSGKPVNIERASSSGYPSYDLQLQLAIRGWRYRPFLGPTGKPAWVCTRVTFKLHMVDRLSEEPPPYVSTAEMRAHRTTGADDFAPDDLTRAEMARRGITRVRGALKMCIDTDGTPTNVTLLRSSGFPAHDDAIKAQVWEWRFRPFTVGGTQTAVCTEVVFAHP
jgi:TonB family protein